MAVYEITNVENTGPTSHEEKKNIIKKVRKIEIFHFNVALFNS